MPTAPASTPYGAVTISAGSSGRPWRSSASRKPVRRCRSLVHVAPSVSLVRIMAMRVWPSATRCSTASTPIATSSTLTEGKSRSREPATTTSTPIRSSRSSSSGPIGSVISTTASTLRRVGRSRKKWRAALLGADLVDEDVEVGLAQRRLDGGEHRGGEPAVEAGEHDRDPAGRAAQRRGGGGDDVVELGDDGQHPAAGARADAGQAAQGARDGRDRDLGPARDVGHVDLA